MTVAPADATVVAMRKKVRRLTGSASEQSLSTDEIDQQLNTVITQDFPAAIKTDQMRSVYTFYTSPNIDRYPLNVNYNQGVRAPVYIDGYKGQFFKERNEFFNLWPKLPTLSHPISGNGVTQIFNFTIGTIPFIPGTVTLGGVDVSGTAIRVSDDGNGNLLLNVPNPVVSVPSALTPVPGMKNVNTANPGDNVQTLIGSVNYVTGQFVVDFALGNVTPIAGQQMSLFVSWYETGRPYSVLFWNNEFHVRPIPKLVHKIEVETYLTAVQLMLVTDVPILTQWWQYISALAAKKVMEERQDMISIANLMPYLKEQEALVLERQATEEIGQQNITIFNATTMCPGWNQGYLGGWY